METTHQLPPPSGFARVTAGLAAVLGPMVLLGLLGLWLARVRTEGDVQASENAGMVFNGQVRAGGAVAAMERVMDRDPDVVLLGPSYANTNLRRELIARRLGIKPGRVALLSVPNSVSAHWYAVLKYRVFGTGHRPKLVVIVSGLQSMLLNTPLTESSWVNLRVQLDDPDDPVVASKARGNRGLVLGRLREQRGKGRDRVMDLVREVPTRLLLPSSARSGGMGPKEVRARLDRVFADEKLSLALHTWKNTPGGAVEKRAYDPGMLPTPEESFMAEIGELCAEYGARLVWARPPMSPKIPAELDDVAPEGFQERAVALAARSGGAFLDMRRLPMTKDMFKNEDHMNREGSRRFSDALGEALRQLDALQPEARPGTEPVEAATLEVVPEPGALPEAEAAWPGAGTWVAPGSELRLHFDGPWTAEHGVFAVKLSAEQLGPDGAPPRLQVAGKPVRLGAVDATAGWRQWRGNAVRKPPAEPFDVVVSVPESGAWLRVTGIALGRRHGRSVVLGSAAGVDGAAARLLGADHPVRPTWPNPPDKVPSKHTVVDLPGRQLARFDTRWSYLADDHLSEGLLGKRCSPLRVREDGEPLPLPNVPCAEVERYGEGRTCHVEGELIFSASDGSDPARNGKAYRMFLDPERRCDDAVWLYPKDRMEVRWPEEQLARFHRGATHFTLGARYLQKRPAKVHLTLTVDGEARIDEAFDGRDLYVGPKVWRLNPPIPVDAKDVRLEVENLEYTFYLFEELALSEGPLPVRDMRWVAEPTE